MTPQPPMSMGLMSTVSREVSLDNFHAWGIRAVTGRGFFRMAPFNHSAWFFDGVDCDPDVPQGARVYFEQWFKPHPESKKNGTQGPIPFVEIVNWKKKNPARREYNCLTLPYPPCVCRGVYAAAKAMVGNVPYAKLQLWHNFKRSVWGGGSLPWLRTPDAMTCSEFAAFLWWLADPGIPGKRLSPVVRYLEIGTRNVLDDVAPAGQVGIFDAARAYLAEQASRTAHNAPSLIYAQA